MELGRINLVLNKNDCVYSPGDIIQGRLEIDMPIQKKIRGIYIKFSGDGGVRFQNVMVISNTGKTQSVLSYADEKYLHYKHECLKNTGSCAILASGKHIYPFSCHLPYDLPSSFHHEYGTIRYFLKTVIEQNRGFKQRSYKDFYVKSYLNLRLYPKLQENRVISLIKKSSFLWLKNIKVKVNIKLPKTGYVVGETISMYIEVINMSERDILDIVFNLQQTLQFYAHSPKKDSKTIHVTLSSSRLGLQPARSAQNFNHQLIIPDFSHESLSGSKIINLRYYLEIIAIRGDHEQFSEKVPITIGNWNV
ncbi:arrestin domain-containing protein 1-like [Onthophagus taurus]|uniref:arrestin domain-containing protein 1-like n=1 Tax=Onthophagus taurus TaxID=166361 RepID=UPI000C1FE6AA|nr:arrestin domain-containing protein 17-like [Onthophagus taurus]XP_022901214.1 arrestin domain-containing protein 17-like [Onthophagus taurus]